MSENGGMSVNSVGISDGYLYENVEEPGLYKWAYRKVNISSVEAELIKKPYEPRSISEYVDIDLVIRGDADDE